MEYSVIYFDNDDVLFVPKNVTVRYSCCVSTNRVLGLVCFDFKTIANT